LRPGFTPFTSFAAVTSLTGRPRWTLFAILPRLAFFTAHARFASFAERSGFAAVALLTAWPD
jgi:hypothetical protein